MGNERGPRGDDGNTRDGDSPSPRNSLPPPVFLSNNFENYRRMKKRNEGEPEGEERRRRDVTRREEEEEEPRSRFAAPPRRSPSGTTPPDRSEPGRAAPPSVFSDLERSRTVDGFANIVMERMGGVMSSGRLSEAWRSGGGGGGSAALSWLLADRSPAAADADRRRAPPKAIDPDDYASEREMVRPHFSPFIWGSSCVVVTLFSLRLGRWYQGARAGKALGDGIGRAGHAGGRPGGRRTPDGGKSLLDARRADQHQSHGGGNPFDPRKEATDGMMASLNTLPVDTALSMLVGISTTIFLTSPGPLMRDLARAPLLEGNSALAEELCPPFREEMRKVNGMSHSYAPYGGTPEQRLVVPFSDLWRDENLGGFDSLRSIRDFVANCHERERAAKRTIAAGVDRNERELMEVKVPPPGISPDLAVSEFDESGILD